MNKLSLVVEENAWNDYRKKYDQASNLELLDFSIQLDFELNASCNLKCPILAESPKGKVKSTWFDFEFYKELIDYSVKQGTRAIKLNYINEPLIRNDFIKFIDYAVSKGIIDIYFSTNGILLREKVSEDLKKAWNSQKMNDLRKKHLNGQYFEIPQCKNCVDGGLE